IASRIAGVGFVAVSERRSITVAETSLPRMTDHDPYTLPPDLPVPEDDGAADHLTGAELPHVTLDSTQGPVDVAELDVLYVYPRTGTPDKLPFPGWDAVPGARGCTPQSCGFRDHAAELAELGTSRIAGLSTQTL